MSSEDAKKIIAWQVQRTLILKWLQTGIGFILVTSCVLAQVFIVQRESGDNPRMYTQLAFVLFNLLISYFAVISISGLKFPRTFTTTILGLTLFNDRQIHFESRLASLAISRRSLQESNVICKQILKDMLVNVMRRNKCQVKLYSLTVCTYLWILILQYLD